MGDTDNWEEDAINDVQVIGCEEEVREKGEAEMMEGGGDGAEESEGDQEPDRGMAYSFNNVLCIRLIHFRTKD